MQLDTLDRKVAEAFAGYVVRKDLVRQFSRQFPVPTYVVAFMLGRYCATIDESEIQEGLAIVQRQLSERTVRAGSEELINSVAREQGQVRIIDIITARLDARTDSYVAELPSLKLRDVRISAELVTEHQRMLTGGFHAEVTLGYDATIAQETSGRPLGVAGLRAIQLSQRDVLDKTSAARAKLTTAEWKDFLLRSIGLEPAQLTERRKDSILLRRIPFVERNDNPVEIGPRGTGKSHLLQQVSPYAHLVSGGKATVARMFVNNANGQRGLVCQYDVVCFDEVSGISFDQKDGVNIMKGYMESGEFSRGKESIRADGSIVMLGNFDVDVEHQQRIGHLFQPLPPEMRDDTAFMDRIRCYLPGWDVPRLKPDLFTDHFGLVSEENLEWAVRLALEVRRRVKEQQQRIGAAEFRNMHFSYTLGAEGVEIFVSTPELQSQGGIGDEPLEAGQIWALSPGGQDERPGLFRLEVTEGPGSGVRVLNKPCHKPSRNRSDAPSRTCTRGPGNWWATAIRAPMSSLPSCAASMPRRAAPRPASRH